MKKKSVLFLIMIMIMSVTLLAACGGSGSAPADNSGSGSTEDLTDPVNGALYGYNGDDPVEAAVYQYMAEVVGPEYYYPDGAISIPTVRIVEVDMEADDGEAEVLGDFWVENYIIEGDTLVCVSGGNHPGKMELIQVGGGFSAIELETVADGESFEKSARDIFEEKYDDFMNVYMDSNGREQLRADTIAAFVKANGLEVTKYQDEGWDPVELKL